jgi:hypothetical protein
MRGPTGLCNTEAPCAAALDLRKIGAQNQAVRDRHNGSAQTLFDGRCAPFSRRAVEKNADCYGVRDGGRAGGARERARSRGPAPPGAMAPVYGMAGGLPDRGAVGDMLLRVQDKLLDSA